jgi:hypothetical protein
MRLAATEIIQIFFKYVGNKIWINYPGGDNEFGILSGVKLDAVQITIKGQGRWFPLYDHFKPYSIKLLIKPLSQLTPEIIEKANSLPVKNFITQYYDRLGFDMPVFVAPDHPANCKNMMELGLADYRSEEQILGDLGRNEDSFRQNAGSISAHLSI